MFLTNPVIRFRDKNVKVLLFFISFLVLPFLFRAYPETGVYNDRIVIGMSAAFTGPSSFLGLAYKKGALSWFMEVNRKGGIGGRKIVLIAYDDGYEPSRCVINTIRLIADDKVFLLFGYVGTPTTVAIKGIVERKRIPLFAPLTGAFPLRFPPKRYIINLRASYNEEVDTFLNYIFSEKHLKKIGILYQNDAFGKTVFRAVKAYLKKRGISLCSVERFERNTENVERAVSAAIKVRPELIIMVGTYKPLAKFVRRLRGIGLNTIFMTVSFVGGYKFLEELGKYGEEVYVTQVVPPPHSQLPCAILYRNLLRRYFPDEKPTFVGFEGFIAAVLFTEVLKRLGHEVTREGFIRTLEGIRNYDPGIGYALSFSKEKHQGSSAVFITMIKNNGFILIQGPCF